MNLTAVILAKNEKAQLERAIDSISFCDEILVIDDNSTDDTVKIARERGATVYKRSLNGDFAATRNFGMEKSRGKWVLFLDADEAVSLTLSRNIQNLFRSEKINKVAYYIKRRDFWWGRELKHGEVHKARKKGFIRLMKKHSGVWVHPVHEEFHVTSFVGKIDGYINHYPHPSVREFLESINFYSSLRAKQLFHAKKQASLFAIMFFPFAKFSLTYFVKRGFLDGPAGFAYAFFMSFHSFLVRAKLYQYNKLTKSS